KALMRALLATAAVLLAAGGASAQPRPDPADLPALRYELGKRLKRFEAEWEKHTAADARRDALAHVEKLTQQFFAFQFGEAARGLDCAAYALTTDAEPGTARQWA